MGLKKILFWGQSNRIGTNNWLWLIEENNMKLHTFKSAAVVGKMTLLGLILSKEIGKIWSLWSFWFCLYYTLLCVNLSLQIWKAFAKLIHVNSLISNKYNGKVTVTLLQHTYSIYLYFQIDLWDLDYWSDDFWCWII